jgi:hypothetical protein
MWGSCSHTTPNHLTFFGSLVGLPGSLLSTRLVELLLHLLATLTYLFVLARWTGATGEVVTMPLEKPSTSMQRELYDMSE